MKARGALLDINLHTITMMNNIEWFGADIGTYDISPMSQDPYNQTSWKLGALC